MNVSSPRMTGPTLTVLGEFLHRPTDQISGIEISRSTGLASGTLYPILFRLEEAGWVESVWEDVGPTQVKRPRRRLYRMTGVGEASAHESVRDVFSKMPEFAL